MRRTAAPTEWTYLKSRVEDVMAKDRRRPWQTLNAIPSLLALIAHQCEVAHTCCTHGQFTMRALLRVRFGQPWLKISLIGGSPRAEFQ